MIITEENYLAHYGILRKSGRYPWGSGATQSERNKTFLDCVEIARKEGLSETDVAKGFGLTTTQLRAAKSIANNEQKQSKIGEAQRLKDKGYSNVAIGVKMNINESSVRSLLAPGEKDKADVLEATSNMLKDQVDKKKFVDIGVGVEHHLAISKTKLNVAVARLQEEGYEVHTVRIQQLGTGKETINKVLCPPGTTQKDVFLNRNNIQQIVDYSDNGGRSYLGLEPPKSISSKRIGINYAEDGGAKADGVIYVRPGVEDTSLGGKSYAQVRIKVDDTHYLKGMAMYKNDLPEGQDLVFNTNKSSTGNKLDAMKELKPDADNPFGATISRQKGVMNIVNEEGDWENWSKTLSSQFLSKQSPKLAKSQLDMTYENKKNDLDDILALTNPAVKRKLLETYADDVDSSAVHLKAAQLPRQGSHVILPINKMKPTEVYAPNFRDGEKVALVRYPHAGTFEIPELTVNNRQPDAKKALGNARDAIAIHSDVAARLSGADFDGDTVLVIPNNTGRVKTTSPLEGLKNFDPQHAYPEYEGMQKITPRTKQIEMGNVSNLITDMTIRGASTTELARAVRHSMVVIDAEKHNLNYKQSAIDNGITQLKTKYQGNGRAGASTLISKASSEIRVPQRKARPASEGGPIDKATGEKVFVETGATRTSRTGKMETKLEKSQKLAETKDANTLSSGTPIEQIYAEHSNKLKDLANTARRESVSIKTTPYSPSAKTAYSSEVKSLDSKLNIALRNAPLERQAQVIANATLSMKRQSNPDMDAAETKKVKAQALAEARTRTGAKKQQVRLTQDEWNAIQAGAVSNNKLTQILNNSDLDEVKKLATPKSTVLMTSTKTARAKSMVASGYTQSEIADALGVSVSTLKRSFGEDG